MLAFAARDSNDYSKSAVSNNGTNPANPNSYLYPYNSTTTPTTSNEIANNPTKGKEVKDKISDTKEDLQKIKDKAKKDKEDAQLKEKIKEEQDKLKEEIKNAPTASPRNK
jgi:hypothetical protein